VPFANDAVKAQLLTKTGIPPRFFNLDPRDIPKRHRDLRSGFVTGDVGVGKTLLLCRLAIRDRVSRGGARSKIYFVPACELLLNIRDSFNGGERSEAAIVEKFAKADVLYLDDLGADKTTDWSIQTLYTILNYRYNHMLPTVISSNCSLDEISERYGARLARRIHEMGPVVCLN